MKKLFALAVILIMLCSFAVSAGALTSPVATEYPTAPASTTPGSSSKESPKTSDPLPLILGAGIAALGAGAVAVKKIKE